MDYVYDFILGNVYWVDYQIDQIDQWYYIYYYDVDNCIMDVYMIILILLVNVVYGFMDVENEQSCNLLWVKEVEYIYYVYGLLGCIELGNDQVQGFDYVYMFQGWMKLVNSNILNELCDLGLDGDVSSIFMVYYNVVWDVYGFSLYYFESDYSVIGGDNSLMVI